VRKILVTGGAGFVGRHLVKKLLEMGDEVHCVDSLEPLTGALDPQVGWPFLRPFDFSNFKFYREDCRAFFRQNQDTDFDYAFHLAAKVGGRLMIENQPLAVADDLSIDSEYWQWALKARPKKTLCFSSSAAYPIHYQRKQSHQLLAEDMIEFQNQLGIPDMSYGWAKLTCEYLARLAFEKHGLKSICYRPFSGYGEDQDDSYPFPGICKRVLKNRGASRIEVWGTGDQMRDFIHIDDCVEGVFKTMDQIDDGNALNLSTGILTSFKDFVKTAADIAGFHPEVVGLSQMPEGVFARGGDTLKQRKYNFQAKVSFREGIERALKYYDQGLG
jgi:nucleoside-diphosphate-sugar epimerase